MLYYFSYLSSHADWGFLRLFNYVSFRAGGAGVAAFLIVLLLGPLTVRLLKKFRATAPSRYGGVVAEFVNEQKDKTPSMGGVLIIFGIIIASVLWMKPTELMFILTGSTLAWFCRRLCQSSLSPARRDSRQDQIAGAVLGSDRCCILALLYP